jgi:NHLM bacteriocin system ABC transporter peptidase/ATP-binding protein
MRNPSFAGGRKRVRVPTLIQLEVAECGAASLGMILAYFGRTEPLESLRLACGVSRDGSRASNIVKAARSFGLNAKGFKKEPAELRQMPLPAIIFWNFNHFVVLQGFGKTKAYLNDPAVGPRAVTLAELDESFTGVVITFEKTPEFQRGGKRRSALYSLWQRLHGGRPALLYLILAALALVLPGIAVPLMTQVFIDHILIGETESWFKPLMWAMGAALVTIGFITFLQQYCLVRVQRLLSLGAGAKFFWHVIRLPMEFFAQRFPAEVGNRISLNDTLASILSGEMATAVAGLLMVFLYAALMVRFDWLLTVIGITIALLNFIVLRWVSRRRKDATLRLMQETGKLQAVAVSGLELIETIKATGRESDFFSRWAGYQAKVSNAQFDLQRSSMVLEAVPAVLLGLNSAAILGLGGLRVMDGFLTMGMLIGFQALMGNFLQPVDDLMHMGSRLQELDSDLRRLDDVLEYPRDINTNLHVPDPEEPKLLDGSIELRNLTFGYSRLEPPLIENFSLTVAPGKRVALVGGSGSGKSTVARLLAGLFQPWSGEIWLDGQPRNNIPRVVLSQSVAFVDQDITLFGGTIQDNLTLWDENIDTPTVVRAGMDSCIHNDIVARAKGYESVVDEDARNFSGGQRQRLEIARALAQNPRLLILDEATSALDPHTEKQIDDSLRRRGCTCLIVAHRLSTIRDCDEIILLQQGKVAERGNHEELMAMGGAYARLVRAH